MDKYLKNLLFVKKISYSLRKAIIIYLMINKNYPIYQIKKDIDHIKIRFNIKNLHQILKYINNNILRMINYNIN